MPLETAGTFRPLAAEQWAMRRYDNAGQNSRNWMIPADGQDTHCLACRHNRTIPDLSDPSNLALWQKNEAAKRRAFHRFARLNLSMRSQAEDPEHGLAFDASSRRWCPARYRHVDRVGLRWSLWRA